MTTSPGEAGPRRSGARLSPSLLPRNPLMPWTPDVGRKPTEEELEAWIAAAAARVVSVGAGPDGSVVVDVQLRITLEA